ncbi:MAG: 30S ribosome-binding factor RbfA [Candidatus Margulisbacteria bacterium]|nr:30S ribosome-binding factor RbfA [Candidatus Margulisiibacteriota bacterium]
MVERHIRVAEDIKRIVSEVISKEIKDSVKLFSIPHVDLTKDISYAKIYLSFFSKNPAKDFEKINHAKGFIRSRLSKQLKLRKVPELTFLMDESIKNGADLIEKINALGVPKETTEEIL